MHFVYGVLQWYHHCCCCKIYYIQLLSQGTSANIVRNYSTDVAAITTPPQFRKFWLTYKNDIITVIR
jgi:hypothetical protein